MGQKKKSASRASAAAEAAEQAAEKNAQDAPQVDPSASRQDYIWQQLGETVAGMVTVHFKRGSPFTSLPVQQGSFDIEYSQAPPDRFESDFLLVVQEFLDASDPDIRGALLDPVNEAPFYEGREKLSNIAGLPNGPGVEKLESQLLSAMVYRTNRPIFGIDWLVIEYNVIGVQNSRRYVGVRVRDVNLQCEEPFEMVLTEHRQFERDQSDQSAVSVDFSRKKSTLTYFLAHLMRTCDWSSLEIKTPYTKFGPYDPATASKPDRSLDLAATTGPQPGEHPTQQQVVGVVGGVLPSSKPKLPTVPLSFLVYADGSAVCTSSTFASASTSTKRARRSVLTDAHDLHQQEKMDLMHEKLKNYNSPRARWHRAYLFAITRVRVEALKNMNSSLRQEVAADVEHSRKKGSLMGRLQTEAKEQVAQEDWSEIQEHTKGYGLSFGPTDVDFESEETKEFMSYEATNEGAYKKAREKKKEQTSHSK